MAHWETVRSQFQPEYRPNQITLMDGQLLRAKGHRLEAVEAFLALLKVQPEHCEAHYALSTLYRELGQHARSKEMLTGYYHYQLRSTGTELDDIPKLVEYLLATHGCEEAPLKPPNGYIENLYDRYSETFESQLTGQLAYKLPQRIAKFIYQGSYPSDLNILDLGCGTGLSGEDLHAFAKTLDGVDLSSKMLDKARAKNIYSNLHQQDIDEFLQACQSQYDLIICLDVLIYFSDLRRVLKQCGERLRAGGSLAFSVEAADDSDAIVEYRLDSTGRYQHGLQYLRDVAQTVGLMWQYHEMVTLRTENKVAVKGYLVKLSKPAVS